MVVYSHSRIEMFNQCKLKYKFRYIDREQPLFEKTIEAFMGSLVHLVLEKLYKDLKYAKINTLEELLKFYDDYWNENWNEDIYLVKDGLDAENYREMGRKYIKNYYKRYYPFDEFETIGLEMEVNIDLNGDNKYVLVGYIDRLAKRDDVIYIIDYKTSNTLPTNDKIEMDRQLALYSIAVSRMYPFAKKIILRWHYLAFDQVLETNKSAKDIDKVKKEIIKDIDIIERESNFDASESVLCEWCEFQHLCPLRKHKIMVSDKFSQKRLFEGKKGKDLVNEYVELKAKKEEIDRKLELLKERLFEYSEKRGVDNLFGDKYVARLRTYKKLDFPKSGTVEKNIVDRVIKENGLWDKYSMLNTFSLSKDIQEGVVDVKIIKELKDFVKPGVVKKIYLKKI